MDKLRSLFLTVVSIIWIFEAKGLNYNLDVLFYGVVSVLELDIQFAICLKF